MRFLGRRPERECVEQLSRITGSKLRILAAVSQGHSVLIGTESFFAHRMEGEWEVVGYHEVANGGWKSDQALMWWQDADGVCHEIPLEQPGLFMELFTERVTATILIDQVIGQGDTKARVVARRDLSDPNSAPIWAITALESTDPGSAEYAQLVTTQLARLKADYGID